MRPVVREKSCPNTGRNFRISTAYLICVYVVAVASACHGLQGDHGGQRRTEAASSPKPLTVIPRKVTSQGNYISHNLTQYHSTLLPDGRTSEATSSVHYVIPLPSDEHDLHLQLKPSKRLTRSSTLVESLMMDDHGKKGKKRSELRGLQRDRLCHYLGKVRGDDASKVALSACDGLRIKVYRFNPGFIQLDYVNPEYANATCGMYFYNRTAKYAESNFTAFKEIKKSAYINLDIFIFLSNEYRIFAPLCMKITADKLKDMSVFNNYIQVGFKRSKPPLTWPPKINSGYIRTKRGYYLIHPIATSSKHITNATHAWGTPQPHHMYPYDSDEMLEGEGMLSKMMAGGSGFSKRRNAVPQINSSTTQLAEEMTEELYVETMVVLDHSMMKHHKDVDLENYVLTVFNMAHSIFHDTSLGRNINLAIVRLVRLEHEDYELNLALNKNPEKTLDYFVEWQQKINPKDDAHPNHHDMAILITRLDVCEDTKMCGWLGAARVGGVCDPNHQVALCQDVGLRLGFVIAHQIGHALGLPHDTTEECGCKDTTIEGSYTVMSPRMSSRTAFWSNCSRNALANFINSGFGDCLHDEPTEHSFELTDILAGVMYDADYQCRTLLGPTAAQCMTGMDCNNLICYIEDKGCVETHVAAAPGTKCSEKKWCVKGKCVFVGERPGAVHGGWGEWNDWSTCSRSCGSGVASQTRHCNNPMPSAGGRFCIGEHTRHKICSTDPCDLNEPSFRDVQCAEFNSWIYPEDGKIHQWKNYPIHDENPCLLFCVNDEGTVASLRPRVIDGTKCQYGMRDICINGLCKEIPCDLDLESRAVEDRCGVCQGDGTSCRIVEGRKYFACTQYVVNRKFTEIPKGAINIKIEETMPSESRIQVRDIDGNILFCGGDDLGLFSVPGSKAWVGMIRAEQEAISIPGPLAQNITIWIDLMQNVTVKYSYGMPVPEGHRRRTHFGWDYVSWSRCSAECGVGTQKASAVCVEQRSGLVDAKYCVNMTRPRELVRGCELAPCTPRWFMGDWLSCDCRHSKQIRVVLCIRPTGEGEGEVNVIDDTNCVSPTPKLKQKCKCRPGRQVLLQTPQMLGNWLPVAAIGQQPGGLVQWPYSPTQNAYMYFNVEGDAGVGEDALVVDHDSGGQTYMNQTMIDANISRIINQTSFQNASAPFNVTKANLTDLLKDESSVDIDALCKDMVKQFDLKTSKNSTVIDFDNITLVELTVHADLFNGEFPEDLPHAKLQNATWYKLAGKKAMHFMSSMQKNYGEENKTQI